MSKPTIVRHLESYRCFVDNGFANWKKSIQSFQSHEKCEYHRISLSVFATSEKDTVSSMLVNMVGIFTSVRYLGRQGLAIRGHVKENSNIGCVQTAHGC